MPARPPPGQPHTVTELLAELDAHLRSGTSAGFQPIPLGFTAFDEAVGGGLRRGDLTIFAGPPGVGKTILALQAARHLAADGRPAIIVCYEHDPTTLLLRLLAQEIGPRDASGLVITALRNRLEQGSTDRLGLKDIIAREPDLVEAFGHLQAIGDNLVILSGSARDTDLASLQDVVRRTRARTGRVPVLLVDSVQKVPAQDSDPTLRSRRVVKGLKDLAMHEDLPVVAFASLNAHGLESRTLRLSHLGAASSIAFEADMIVLLNEKIDAIARAHVAYGGTKLKEYREWVVWTIAKNRSGPDELNLEFHKDFRHLRFEPRGRKLSERLADDRFDGDAG